MRNLIKLFDAVSPSTLNEGLTWYRQANTFCLELSVAYGKPLDVVCAVMSALSPATNYEQNKKDTLSLLANVPMYKCTTYGANVSKARSILRGVLNPTNAFSLKTGAKTYNFYHNILLPDCVDYVTIDRHAYNLAMTNDYKSLSPNQYLHVAQGYIKAARAIGILPNQLQAVLWVDYRIKQNISFKTFAIDNCPF